MPIKGSGAVGYGIPISVGSGFSLQIRRKGQLTGPHRVFHCNPAAIQQYIIIQHYLLISNNLNVLQQLSFAHYKQLCSAKTIAVPTDKNYFLLKK